MTSPTPSAKLLPLPLAGEGRGESAATSPTRNGFTLLEMIVVIVILGLVGGLVLTRAPQHGGSLDLRAATSLVTGTLRTARSRAMVADTAIPVRFDAASVQLGNDPARRLPAGIRIAGAAPAILFRPDGSSSGGTIDLAGRADHARIAVNWLTSHIAIAPTGAQAGDKAVTP